MGWTHCNKPAHITPAQFCASDWDGVEGRSIVAKATVNNVIYLALRIDKPNAGTLENYIPAVDGSVTAALVYLTSKGDGRHSYYNFGYKSMDEGMGPCEATASASFLNKLSPLREGAQGYAANWRARCQGRNTKKQAALDLQDGMKVQLSEPVKFNNGVEAGTFIVRKLKRRGRFATVFEANGTYYRLRPEHKLALRETI